MQKSSFFERSPIRSRSQSDWAAFAIRLGCVRNLIGLRSQSDWTAFGERWQKFSFKYPFVAVVCNNRA